MKGTIGQWLKRNVRGIICLGSLAAIAALCLCPPWEGRGMYLTPRSLENVRSIQLPDPEWWPIGHHPVWFPPKEHRWHRGAWLGPEHEKPLRFWTSDDSCAGLRAVRIDGLTLAVEFVPLAILFGAAVWGGPLWRRVQSPSSAAGDRGC